MDMREALLRYAVFQLRWEAEQTRYHLEHLDSCGDNVSERVDGTYLALSALRIANEAKLDDATFWVVSDRERQSKITVRYEGEHVYFDDEGIGGNCTSEILPDYSRVEVMIDPG